MHSDTEQDFKNIVSQNLEDGARLLRPRLDLPLCKQNVIQCNNEDKWEELN